MSRRNGREPSARRNRAGREGCFAQEVGTGRVTSTSAHTFFLGIGVGAPDGKKVHRGIIRLSCAVLVTCCVDPVVDVDLKELSFFDGLTQDLKGVMRICDHVMICDSGGVIELNVDTGVEFARA